MRLEPDLQVQLHSHPGGEEILVLEGDFADEHGEYSKGVGYAVLAVPATLQRLVQTEPCFI